MKCDKLQECCSKQLKDSSPIISCNRIASCIKYNGQGKSVSCRENRCSYQYENTQGNQVVLYHMDGGIIDDNTTAKCDYLLVAGNQILMSILVELKGSDVSHAIEQIGATLKEFPDFFNGCDRVHARIIATQTAPNIMATQKVVRLKRSLQRLNGTLQIKTRMLQEHDSNLL